MKSDSDQDDGIGRPLETSIESMRGSGSPLAEVVKGPLENAFNTDFSGVRVHTNAQADGLNQSIQAKAFTTGQDVFFRQGAYQPDSREGQELIAHELTHVVQQTGLPQRLVQRALWQNSAAKFRTDNGDPHVPNSEYLVNSAGYQRYAPINITRAPEQVYHEGPRSFVYIRSGDVMSDEYDALWEEPQVTGVASTQVTFKSRKAPSAPTVTGYITPQEGDTVYDLDVDEKGNGSHQHVGHPVEELGQTLPTLDDPVKQTNVKAKQANFWMMQHEYENSLKGQKIKPTGHK